MKKITLPGQIGDKSIDVEITQPNGAGDLYHVFADKFYQGIITKRNNEWVTYLNDNSFLSAEDIEIILNEVRSK